MNDRDELARRDLATMTRAYKAPMNVMRGVAFAIGCLVVALSVYTLMMDRRREYGILKAMGANGRHMLSIALRQTAIVAGLGLVCGALLFLVGRYIITAARPQFSVVATAGATFRATGAALVMALIASLLPAHQLSRLAPASAYQSG